MSKQDLYYSIFSILGMVVAGFIIYQAFYHKDKVAIVIICINLAIAYGDYIYKKREGSFLYGFISGLTKEQQNDR